MPLQTPGPNFHALTIPCLLVFFTSIVFTFIIRTFVPTNSHDFLIQENSIPPPQRNRNSTTPSSSSYCKWFLPSPKFKLVRTFLPIPTLRFAWLGKTAFSLGESSPLMAMEICSENSSSTLVMSPARISFSYDLSQSDAAPIEHHFRSNSSSSSGVDFDFCTQAACAQASSSADELFSDGKILPFRIKENVAPQRRGIQPPEVLAPDLQCGKGEIEEGLKEERKGAISESEEKHVRLLIQ